MLFSLTVLALREIWESETPKNCPGTSKNQCQEVWDSQVLKIFDHYKKNLERICMLFSLEMAVLFHKREFKNMEIKCLEVRDTI